LFFLVILHALNLYVDKMDVMSSMTTTNTMWRSHLINVKFGIDVLQDNNLSLSLSQLSRSSMPFKIPYGNTYMIYYKPLYM
jgi:hypothetical protein